MQNDGIVFVDADDTLWENNRWFQAVIDEWAALLARHGVPAETASAALRATEDHNIPVTGYGSAAFVRSAVETFHALVPCADGPTREEMARFARRAETEIREHPIELLPGVADAIPELARRHRVVVLTKGEVDEQRSKVDRSGLARWLTAVHVVAEKDAACYLAAARLFETEPSRSWMIGNSPASDVNPALAAGLRAIHVPHPAPWHRDEGPVDPGAVVVTRFADAAKVVVRASSGP